MKFRMTPFVRHLIGGRCCDRCFEEGRARGYQEGEAHASYVIGQKAVKREYLLRQGIDPDRLETLRRRMVA